MVAIRYKALDAEGKFVVGELDVADARQAAQRLSQLGFVPLETQAGPSKAEAAPRLSWRNRVGPREITVFLRELALLLRAGLVLDEALHLLAGEEGRGLAKVARDLRNALAGGAGFAEALRRFPALFGPELVAMVRVAEASGSLEAVLESVAEDRLKTERLMDKVSSSLRYPAFLLLAAGGVLVFFLVAVVPQFATVIRDFGGTPDGVVAMVLELSDFVIANGDVLAASVAIVLALALLAFRRAAIRQAAGRGLRRLPGLRGILQLRRTVLFCSSLGTLLKNGVTLTEALRVMLDRSGAGADGLERVVEGVRRGGRLVDALAKIGYLPPIALKMLRVGEESGELAAVSRRTADFYETKLADRLERLAGIVGPAAIVTIAFVVGGLIVSILTALLSVNQLAL